MPKPKVSKSIQIPDHILRKLLTDSEIRMLKNRWQIIQYLKQGLSIRKIAKQVKVGTDTVVRAARMMEKAEFKKIINSERNKSKSATPWIFGQSE